MSEIELPYFAARPAEPPSAGVVVLHEANGISPQLIRFCQRLAAEGYLVIAPDLYFRSGGSEAEPYADLMATLEATRTQDDIGRAADVVRSTGVTKVGVTGFCMGGLLSYRTAVRNDGFSAAAGFYGSGISRELARPRCPTMLFFGADDPYIPRAEAEAVAAHHPDTVIYEGADHGFMRDGSDSYHAESASDAWERLLAFFGKHLAP
ncbi:MAG: carboxymethylenebutenolidase [Acidimicrobiia bacterium]|nr:carboxymethylenebutenolidase [Acidimicrobiia bacterium]